MVEIKEGKSGYKNSKGVYHNNSSLGSDKTPFKNKNKNKKIQSMTSLRPLHVGPLPPHSPYKPASRQPS